MVVVCACTLSHTTGDIYVLYQEYIKVLSAMSASSGGVPIQNGQLTLATTQRDSWLTSPSLRFYELQGDDTSLSFCLDT